MNKLLRLLNIWLSAADGWPKEASAMAEHFTLLDRKDIYDQFQRITFLKYFPRKLDEVASYQQEFNRVMMRCKSNIMAVKVIDDWIDNNTDRPTFSELAQLIAKHIVNANDSDKNSTPREKKCQRCYGDGHVSVPLLLTYHSDSGYEIKSIAPMPDVDWTKAVDFRKKIGANQDIIGGTIKCACHNGVVEDQDMCQKCSNFGYGSGRLAGHNAGPWKWCDCAWAALAKSINPELVKEANTAREVLLSRFEKIPAGVQSRL